ncbi:MAG: sulfide/dihydroorotate dehydrogenase-like FAD/NAD-binding protein [Treponema sp.]|jgi:ferredoxin--NADP+ reductase|nr:sulfide/dihydroorotate dehydrogenase-like FAD/NAD-binding protein [Treponema sp.]
MVKIIRKKSLNPTVTLMEVSAPLEAARAEPGQFVILRANENGERIPLTIADFDREKGTVTLIFQIVGAATWQLDRLREGDTIPDFAGPLGRPTDCGAGRVAIVGGGVGSAIAYPVAKKFHQKGAEVHAITGFRTKELVILEEEFRAASSAFVLMTDDGSYGRHGLVTEALQLFIDKGERYDEVIAIGPLPMMKFVAAVTKPYGIKTTVSMNPIMIDGTGMCGGCRLSVGGKTKFACVDGPDFDGHEVDFNEAIARSAMYKPFEAQAMEECRLFGKGGTVTETGCAVRRVS